MESNYDIQNGAVVMYRRHDKFELENVMLPKVMLTLARIKVMVRTVDFGFC